MRTDEIRRHTRPGVSELAQRLAREYADVCPFGVVMAEVLRAREELFVHGVRAGILDATEAATRHRLRQRGIEPSPVVHGETATPVSAG